MAVREAILSVAGGSLPIVVMVVVLLVREAVIIVMVGVRVMRVARMRVAMVMLLGPMAERVMLDTVVVPAKGVVKRHVYGWQNFEAGEPKQAGQHGADTNL